MPPAATPVEGQQGTFAYLPRALQLCVIELALFSPNKLEDY